MIRSFMSRFSSRPSFMLLATMAVVACSPDSPVAPFTVQPSYIAAGDWTTKPDMASGRGALGAGVINGILYAVGGTTAVGGVTSSQEAYDPATNSWTARAPMSTARYGLGVGVLDGILYAVGGSSNVGCGGTIYSTVEAYNPATNTWTPRASLPVHKCEMGPLIGYNHRLYAIGGYSPESGRGSVEEYNPTTNTWTSKAPMPTGRGWAGVALLDGLIYAIGGLNNATAIVATVEAYDPVTDTWTTKASLPTARYALSAVTVGSTLFSIGSLNDQNVVSAYDPVTNSWTSVSALPTPRGALAAAVINDVVYAVGGFASAFSGLKTLEAFTPPRTWNTFAPMPYARGGSASAVVGKSLFVVGGGGDGGPSVVLGYDATTNAWTRKPDLPYPQSYTAAASIGGIVYVAGGCGQNGDCAADTHNRLHAYDAASDTWRTLPSMPSARHSSGGVAFHGKFWVFGGRNGNVGTSSAVEAYDPTSNRWTTYASMPRPRVGVAAVELNDLIYLIGGSDNVGAVTTFETFDPLTQTWTVLPPMPRLVAAFGAAVANGRIYVIAAYDVNPATLAYTLTNRVMVYDPATASWSDGPPITTRRYAPAPQVIGSTIFVAGNGEANQASKSLEGFTLAPEDVTGTITIPPVTFGNISIRDLLQIDALSIWVIRVSDGAFVEKGDWVRYDQRVFSGLAPGEYRVELRDRDNYVVMASTKTLPPRQTVKWQLDLGTVATLVSAPLTVNGQITPDGAYMACNSVFRCNGGRNGGFKVVVPAGSGAFEIRTPAGGVLGTFTYTGAVGQTLTSFKNATGDVVTIAQVNDLTGTITIPTVTYGDISIRDLLEIDALSISVIRVSDGKLMEGDWVRYDARVLNGMSPGDYRAELRDRDNALVVSNTKTLLARGTVELPLDLRSVAGLLKGSVNVNGQPADGSYKVCVAVFRCNAVKSGMFQIPVMPGPGSFEIKTSSDVVLGTFTFSGAIGQTLFAGSVSDAAPGSTSTGTNVSVRPVNSSSSTTNANVSMSFTNVSASGTTTVTQSSAGPRVPAGIQLGTPATYYNITTTALFSGPIQVCVNYTGTAFQSLEQPKLLHGNADGTWTDVTTSIDRTNSIICGTVTSLSPFVVATGNLNRAPIITIPTSNFSGSEGSPVSLIVNANDPDGDALTYAWDLGDGSMGTGTLPSTHVYADNGTYSITLTASDPAGLSDTKKITATISNVAPTITTIHTPPPTPVGTYVYINTDFVDPGSADTHTAKVDWNGTVEQYGAVVSGFTSSRTFLSPGDYPVTVTVTDKDGASHSLKTTISVFQPDNSAPVIVPVVSGPQGNDGWYRGDVHVSFQVKDAESAISNQDGCSAVDVTADTNGQTFTCTATSAGGTSSKSVSVKRDATAPAISYAGNASPYTFYQTMNVACAASDAGSGIASTTCANVTGTGASIGLGSHDYNASATDNAGNTANATTTITVVDVTAPVIVPTVSGTLSATAWYTSDVNVSWSVSDLESAVSSTNGCSTSSVKTDGAGFTFSCSATSAGGTNNKSASFKRDGTAPVVTYAGNAGSYSVDQNVAITCSSSDNLSGVASSTCANVTGAAYSFGLGTHSYSASATDVAGNRGNAATSFTVNVSAASLGTLTQSLVTNASVSSSLSGKLDAAAASAARGNTTASQNQLNAYINQVRAQTGKTISAADAAVLIALATALM